MLGKVDYITYSASSLYLFYYVISIYSYAVNVLAFQSVPRDLRRRTASHDHRRLPQKLRERAAKEVSKKRYIFLYVCICYLLT